MLIKIGIAVTFNNLGFLAFLVVRRIPRKPVYVSEVKVPYKALVAIFFIDNYLRRLFTLALFFYDVLIVVGLM